VTGGEEGEAGELHRSIPFGRVRGEGAGRHAQTRVVSLISIAAIVCLRETPRVVDDPQEHPKVTSPNVEHGKRSGARVELTYRRVTTAYRF
jgi:hypothetical protein